MEYNKQHNTIYIIGNGFDLAHNLPTSYLDFFVDLILRTTHYSGDFTNLKSSFKETQKHPIVNLGLSELKNNFLNQVTSEYNSYKWIDIEYSFFKSLYKIIHEKENDIAIYKAINDLNIDFEKSKYELYKYITKIDKTITSSLINSNIVTKFNITKSNTRSYAINFNYTRSILAYKPYLNRDNVDFEVIHINGKVYDNYLDTCDNIVFGFGDEYSDSFNTIKEYHSALKYYKSIEYSIRPEFGRINEILTEPYNLVIMGHSCGISDRTLLSMLTNNKNLRKIVIYCENRNDNYERLLYLKQSTENGRIFKDTEIDKGLCD